MRTIIRYAKHLGPWVFTPVCLLACVAMARHPGPSLSGRQLDLRDSLPWPGSLRPAGDATEPTVFLIDDAPGHVQDVPVEEIGLIEVRGQDSILPSKKAAKVVRIYTKAFIAEHRERFGDVPALKADTLSTPTDSGR